MLWEARRDLCPANILAAETHEMCRLFLNGQEKESLRLQLELLDLMNAFLDNNPVPLLRGLKPDDGNV